MLGFIRLDPVLPACSPGRQNLTLFSCLGTASVHVRMGRGGLSRWRGKRSAPVSRNEGVVSLPDDLVARVSAVREEDYWVARRPTDALWYPSQDMARCSQSLWRDVTDLPRKKINSGGMAHIFEMAGLAVGPVSRRIVSQASHL